MTLHGRIEKRVPVEIQVYLIRLRGQRTAEQALTENVSPRGARVVTGRSCEPGEEVRLTALSHELNFSARVIYCQQYSSTTFCVGLEYRQSPVKQLAIPHLIPSLVF
jgi:hypothetical protein